MGRTVEFTEAEIDEARRMVSEAADVREFKHGMSVVLSVDLRLTNKQVATALLSSPATVVRMHGRVRSRVDKSCPEFEEKSSWGGRRHAYMTMEEEREFLRPWEERAASGGFLIVSPIHRAFPVEHLWDEIREKSFANRVFDSLGR